MEVFRLENLSFAYPGASQKALKDISLAIESGEVIVVCGQSGCGKTTLLKMFKRELTPHGEKAEAFILRASSSPSWMRVQPRARSATWRRTRRTRS